LVLFINGIAVVTLELKSEFNQSVHNAITQYKLTRTDIDQQTKKREPLLTFKRGALVHFAASQYEVYMTTRLEGADTFFLPFNKGTKDGGSGNDGLKIQRKTPPIIYGTKYCYPTMTMPMIRR
jgi:type I restriction enzyme R subunit